MNITKVEQIVLSIAVALAGPVSEALINLNAATLTHPSQWFAGLLVGCATAIGIQIKIWSTQQGRGPTPPAA